VLAIRCYLELAGQFGSRVSPVDNGFAFDDPELARRSSTGYGVRCNFCGLFPFVRVIYRDEAAPPLERFAEGWRILDPLSLSRIGL